MGVRASTETRVNTTTSNNQSDQKIVTLADGGWVVTWQSNGQNGGADGIYQQAYNADGSARGVETRVSAFAGNTSVPQIAALDGGGWVITWQSTGQDFKLTAGIYQQAFNADGSARGGETLVNTYVEADQTNPRITELSDGGWVITWQSYGQDNAGSLGVYQQAYNVDGSTRGIETQVNTFFYSDQYDQQVAALSNGGWVVTWSTYGQDGSGLAVYQQTFNADGSARGVETQVNTYIYDDQRYQQVTGLADGGWVVTWQTGSDYDVFQQAYHADGSKRGVETQVNTYKFDHQMDGKIAALADGGWVVTWNSYRQDGSIYGVYQQAFNADGTAKGVETHVSTYTTSNQAIAEVTALTGGGWVVTWYSNEQDGSKKGVYQQAYNADGSTNGVEMRVNTYTVDDQASQKVTALPDGGWVVTWTSLGQDGSGYGVYQRVFHLNTSPQATGDRAVLKDGFQATAYTISEKALLQGFTDTEGDSLSVTSLSTSAGTVTKNGDGTWTITPYTSHHGSAKLNYTISDGVDQVDASLSFTLVANKVPHSIALSGTKVQEHVAINTVVGSFSAIDPEGKALTYKLMDDAGGLFKLSGNKLVTAKAIDYNFFQKDTVVVQVSDGVNTVLEVFAINVLDVRDTITGTSMGDMLRGGAGADVIIGLAGHDALDGGAGDDTLIGGEGGDALFGGDGIDTAAYTGAKEGVVANLVNRFANAGDAQSDSYYSIENLTGSSFSDTLTGDMNANVLDGGAGNDTLDGGAGADRLVGGAGSDTASYLGASKSVVANLAKASLNTNDAKGDSYSSIENLTGSYFSDTLTGDMNANVLKGEAGNDTLDGGTGNDTLDGGAGFDRLVGGAGSDTASYLGASKGVIANLAKTSLNTNDAKGDRYSSIENLTGSSFSDTLTGDTNANVLDGGSGNDTLDGGAGADRLFGGVGWDTASYLGASKGVVANLTKPSLNTNDAKGDIYSSVENLTGSTFSDTLTGDMKANVLKGEAGNDTLDGGAGNDTMDGGAGADRLFGGAGSDTTSYLGASKGVVANLAKPSLNTNDAKGDSYSSVENLTGTHFSDKLTGDMNANVLKGGAGNDTLDGGAGNDTLEGGAGFDVFRGGVGKDAFVFKAASELGQSKTATDTVIDFSQADKDVIHLASIDANTKTVANDAFTFIGTGAFHKKAGELRYEKAGADTYLYGDTDGDGKADFVLHFDSALALRASDFIL